MRDRTSASSLQANSGTVCQGTMGDLRHAKMGQVRVLPGVQSFFVVLHGSINVTNLDVTVAAVADRIVLIGPSWGDTFALSGEVTAIGAASWTVAGQTISVDDETEIEPGLAVGDVDLGELVELDEGVALEEGESIGDALDDSVVTIHVCVLPDGEVVVINIIIIVIVGDQPPPPPDEGEGESGKVTVCHKPDKNAHTITIARPALPAHLGHGDYVGACR